MLQWLIRKDSKERKERSTPIENIEWQFVRPCTKVSVHTFGTEWIKIQQPCNTKPKEKPDVCENLSKSYQGVGCSDSMTHILTNLYQFEIESSDSMVSYYTRFVDSIDAIEAWYPANGDKIRLWQDFKTHRYVQALKARRIQRLSQWKGSYWTSMARPLVNPSWIDKT